MTDYVASLLNYYQPTVEDVMEKEGTVRFFIESRIAENKPIFRRCKSCGKVFAISRSELAWGNQQGYPMRKNCRICIAQRRNSSGPVKFKLLDSAIQKEGMPMR